MLSVRIIIMMSMIEQLVTIHCSGSKNFRKLYTYEQLDTPQGRENWVKCPSYD